MEQIVQVLGALLVLVAFAALQSGRMRADSIAYVALNLFGSAVLTVLAWHEDQWCFLLLEAVWAVVSAWFAARAASSRSALTTCGPCWVVGKNGAYGDAN